tara:strand:+ start:423 stop:800 length:378 start_codon:yes stop_codon:yes gene_type:complete
MAIKIVYKNHCTPQERVDFSTGSRWYLDSDCGRKLSGSCEPTVTIATTYVGTGTINASGDNSLESGTTVNFVFVKNTGSNDLKITIRTQSIILSAGESFASQIADLAVSLQSASGTTYEYFLGKD